MIYRIKPELCHKIAQYMKIHREGRWPIIMVLAGAGLGMAGLSQISALATMVFGLAVAILGILVAQFFRNPARPISQASLALVYAPADGKVVVIEAVEEPEYIQKRCWMISIFMSPLNVHVNRCPIPGEVRYVKYHPGKYLVAWHPKSSTENERFTTVIGNARGEVLVRQIAGAVARRICNYLQAGQQVAQGQELGFIKFGSRVDVFLPLDSEIAVNLGDAVKGNKTVLATLP